MDPMLEESVVDSVYYPQPLSCLELRPCDRERLKRK